MISHTLVAAAAAFLVATTTAQKAIVTIEASHGGAGNGLTNATVEIPLGTIYTNTSALDAVSELFLTGAEGIAVESITCTPYKFANGTGTGGLPFNSTSPSYLSTNTVQVGSIVCNGKRSRSAASVSTAKTSNWTASSTTPTTPISNSATGLQTSTYTTLVKPLGADSSHLSTVTSTFSGLPLSSISNDGAGTSTSTIASSPSPSASPSTQTGENAGDQLSSSPFTFAAIGMGLLGLAFWL